MMAQAVNLSAKLAGFSDHWAPRIVACFDGCEVMVVKGQGAFTWRARPDTDDFFLVLKGRLGVQLCDGHVTLGTGEPFMVPRGVEHCSVAEEEAHLLLIEPAGRPNTVDPATAAARRQA